MNEQHNDNTNPLHLSTEPELQEIESLLEAMGRADRAAMSQNANARMLEAVSAVFAPQPISLEAAHQQAEPILAASSSSGGSARWKLRIAAAFVMVSGVTLSLLVLKPWAMQPTETPASNTGTWSLASFEEDLDAYLALDEVGDESLDEAVTNWELWAQTIDTSIDTELLGSGIGLSDLSDGAL